MWIQSFSVDVFQVDEVADRYLVCSQHYKTVRDGLARMKLTSDTDGMTQVMQVCLAANVPAIILYLYF